MEKTIQDEARWCESNNAKIIYSIDSEKESRRRNREGGGGERKKVSDALNCATINLPIRKTDELFVNNGVTSIYLWAPPLSPVKEFIMITIVVVVVSIEQKGGSNSIRRH